MTEGCLLVMICFDYDTFMFVGTLLCEICVNKVA